MDQIFRDRRDAGRQLAEALVRYRGTPDLLVLALPRGGVPVAYEVARALNAELDVLVVRKLGVPYQPELAMGAITSGGSTVLNDDMTRLLGITLGQIEETIRGEQRELARRERDYRGDRAPLRVAGRTVIVIDDGVATGASMLAAVKALRSLKAARIVVAVPIGSDEALRELEALADDCLCLSSPPFFYAVGRWYRDFSQVGDEEVRELLSLGALPGAARRRKPQQTDKNKRETRA
jgi:putative phosphoribosyl transferase